MSDESRRDERCPHGVRWPHECKDCLAAPPGSAEYVAAKCLREEVARFKRTNRFTPMEVTGFYIQAAVVLDEHEAMVKALRTIRDYYSGAGYIGALAESALPPNRDIGTK